MGDAERDACSICERNDVRLVDAVVDNEIKKICDSCAAIHEDIVIIPKPTAEQLKESERSFTVYERLRRMARLKLHDDELELREAGRRREAQINLAKLAAVRSDQSFRERYSGISAEKADTKVQTQAQTQPQKSSTQSIDFKSSTVTIADLKKMRDEMSGRNSS